MISEVGRRYARAIFELTRGNGIQERVFNELRSLKQSYTSDAAVAEFLSSPMITPTNKVAALQAALSGKITSEVLNLLKLLAEKNRLEVLPEIVDAYEEIADSVHGVTRGKVVSAAPLSTEERKKIEETVTRVTKKKVILNFEEDTSLLGGMVAQVGGWTFDDSLKSHLVRINEDLNRRTH
jgi:F-type H+-transporting ATPase subunit delta